MAKRVKSRVGAVTITDTDNGFSQVMDEFEGAGTIEVGMVGPEAERKHPKADMTVAELAAIHELGLGVPARQWLRGWFDLNQARVQSDMETATELIKLGYSRKQAFTELGQTWADEIRGRILRGEVPPPLSATTIASKGGETRPLVETETLANAVNYKLTLPFIKSIASKAIRAGLRKRR